MMNKVIAFSSLVSVLILTGCVPHALYQKPKNQAKIGIMSTMGRANFANNENIPTVSKTLTPFNFDSILTSSLAQRLKMQGYQNVSFIALKPKQSPVEAAKAHRDLNLVIVVSPDEGTAPTLNSDSHNADLVYGYGVYTKKIPNTFHTFGYANYDISVYDAKSLDLLASQFYSDMTLLSNNKELSTLEHWLKGSVTSRIAQQTLHTIGA